jgi:EPS-associated MarR family transcriptional regulator
MEIRHKVLKLISENPNLTQRELAEKLGVSLGKTNYCLSALVHKGYVKMNNLKNSKNKKAYIYALTPAGIEQKLNLTLNFLKIKIKEYEEIKKEIEELKIEVGEKYI